MRDLAETFPIDAATTILDVGGTPLNWSFLPAAPQVTLLNLAPADDRGLPPNLRRVQGDGRSLPFGDGSFDICFSNSTIEHVGSYAEQERLAQEILRVGRGVYVQTPARSFPFEPHWYALFVHWLPRALQRRILRWVSGYGLARRPDRETVEALVDEYRLLSLREMRRLFPGCEIRRERFGGLTKAYVAVRRPG